MADEKHNGTTEKSAEDTIIELGGKALAGAKGFGLRVFVHVVALVCGATVALMGSSFLAGACVYAGVICIVARGVGVSPEWLIPASIGLVQTGALAALGFPLPHAIFWGGAQSWLQRLLGKRMNMGSEWVALFLLLPLGIYLLRDVRPITPFLCSFFGLLLVGRIVARIVRRKMTVAVAADAMPLLESERLVAQRVSLEEFKAKLVQLPQSVRPVAEAIAVSAGNILDSMSRDSRDMEPGHRFLNRYLKAAHTVTDKHVQLARENVVTPEIIEALAKSEEMFSRLDGAFAQEHERLLRNDVSDFSANLQVLDTLLKMDGK